MNALNQFIASVLAVAMLVAVAAWGSRPRHQPRLDEGNARRLLDEEFPDVKIDGLWLADDRRAAVARSGDVALVLTQIGAYYAGRRLPWATVVAAPIRDGKLRIEFREPGASRAALAFSTWPPKEFAA